MVDHLPLPAPIPVMSRRFSGGASTRTVDRSTHGPRVASALRSAVDAAVPTPDQEDEESVTVVALKLATRGETTMGPFRALNIEVLGEDENWNYYVLADNDGRQAFLDVIEEYASLSAGDVEWEHPKTWAHLIDNINDVELYGRDDRTDASLERLEFAPSADVECLLWPAKTKKAAQGRIRQVRAVLDEIDDETSILDIDDRPDWLVVRVAATGDGLEALLGTNVVQKVVAPPTATVTADAVRQVEIPEEFPDPTQTRIGVVDGIVSASNPFVANFVETAQDFPTGHLYPGPDGHGTPVAGIAIWGDMDGFIKGRNLSVPVPVLSARVLEVASATSTRIVGNPSTTIEEAIRWLASQNVRVISISINYDTAASSSPSRMPMTYMLDQLARELNLVIVVSSGNLDPVLLGDHPRDDYPDYLTKPESTVASPGDAALVMTVGSFARRDVPDPNLPTRSAVAKVSQPSHFTRVTTDLSGQVARRKPEFVDHGGNGVWDTSTDQPVQNDPGTSVIVPVMTAGVSPLGFDNGTSFAAPKVAHEVALISERYPDAGANLLRALTSLSARHIVHSTALDDARISAYGVPLADRILESGPARVVLTFEGSIDTNTTVVHPVPIPPEFSEIINTQDFRVALAFDPPVRRNRREYIAGKMRAELVRGISQAAVMEIYSRQPTQPEIDNDPSLAKRALPDREFRPNLDPPANILSANTLITREYPDGEWDSQHGDYFLIVTHMHNPSTDAQRRKYPEQAYAAAVELRLRDRPEVDLYALIQARVRTAGRAAGRA